LLTHGSLANGCNHPIIAPEQRLGPQYQDPAMTGQELQGQINQGILSTDFLA
jgi:hypothetical protein